MTDPTLHVLNDRFPCRELQIRLLWSLLSNAQATPSALIIHGSTGTGKSSIVKATVNELCSSYAVVNCRECITARHLFEQILRTVLPSSEIQLPFETDKNPYTRCENINTLAVFLNQILAKNKRFILVLDDFEKAREIPVTLLAAVVRLGQIIPTLSVIIIVANISTRIIRLPGIPHVAFPPYSRHESIRILSTPSAPIFLQNSTEHLALKDMNWVWVRYLDILWDSLAKDAARDIGSFRELAEKQWGSFVMPIIEGAASTQDFSRLIISKRGLFQDEDALAERIVGKRVDDVETRRHKIIHDLSYHSKYLLCASYLASYISSRQDATFFMKSTEKKRKKKGTVTVKGRPSRNRRIPRQLLSPSPFTLDRLLSIFHAIVPISVAQTAEVHTQIATLRSLRLLIRSGISSDSLDPTCKWRVNFSLDFITTLGRSVGFELNEYLVPLD